MENKLLACGHLLRALFVLNKIMCDNNVEYVITGTMGLTLLRVPQECIPEDIDVVAYDINDEQKKVFETLQKACSFKKTDYPDSKCYTIEVLGVKVNVIVEEFDYKRDTPFPGFPEYTIFPNSVTINILESAKEIHMLKVMPFEECIKRKMRLDRAKDKQYMLDLIKNLASI